jgi:hypothetical protein
MSTFVTGRWRRGRQRRCGFFVSCVVDCSAAVVSRKHAADKNHKAHTRESTAAPLGLGTRHALPRSRSIAPGYKPSDLGLVLFEAV